jgi:hypothetical protein
MRKFKLALNSRKLAHSALSKTLILRRHQGTKPHS